ncbi:hybrid sensor histidine kinase/response regulator [Massilia haematophila]|uniref:histidine kinase n=1 Tax=Massilia haematophila TaxID=457923 RepID=A0ABV7PI96_9BURK
MTIRVSPSASRAVQPLPTGKNRTISNSPASLILFVSGRDEPEPAVSQVGAQLGQDVVQVRTGAEGLVRARATDFALILVEHADDTPALLDTVALMRANRRSSHTPIVVLGVPSAPSFPLEPVYEAGAIAVLSAPVSPVILAAKARFYLDAFNTAAERRRAEQALGAARERLEATLAAADLAVWKWDVDADCVRGDARLAAIFGDAVPPDAPMAAYFAAIHPDDRAATRARLDAALRHGEGEDATFRVRAPDGRWRWIIARGRIGAGADGRPATVSGIMIDATRQFETERQLRASEERYRTLFDAMDEAMCVIEVIFDAGGRPYDYRFLETNPAFAGQTGLVDAVGRRMRDLAPGHEQHWFDIFGRVVATGEPARFVNEARALGRWFDLYAMRIGPPGERRVAVLFTDITARRRAEEELRRLAADLAEANRVKTEFLATLAHELRNPLAPIRNGLQLLGRAGTDAGAAARVHAIIDRQLDQLVHLVDDLLDLARVNRGQVELRRSWIDLGEVLAAAVDGSLPLIEAADHTLSLRLPDKTGRPLRLYADPTRLTQVISNLLNNAARYTPRGGAIALAAGSDGEHAVITVSDDGIGIAADALERVFQMFTQVGANGAQGGLGIGLSLVRSLVELHGGSVTAASAGPGAGSVFTVRLPLAARDAPPMPAAAAAPAAAATSSTATPLALDGAALRVLVVDDNRDAADTLAALLVSMGHTTAVAHDGYQALRMLPGFAPQVVFLDLGMPGLSGYDVAAEVRKDRRNDGVRLVALTGWGGAADRERSARAGFDRHLTKPAALEAIGAALALGPAACGSAATTPA